MDIYDMLKLWCCSGIVLMAVVVTVFVRVVVLIVVQVLVGVHNMK